MTSRPLTNISYDAIANARKGARSKTVDVACPACGPQHKGDSAKRKVMRTWSVSGDKITVHCVRCGLDGWVAPDGGTVRTPVEILNSGDDDERKRQRNAEFAERIWRETYSIAGTAGEAYFNRRGIDLAAVPDFGGLRWHPQSPWEGRPIGCVLARYTDAITGEPRGIHRRPIDGQKPRTLGPMRGCVIRLWPDEEVTIGLVLGEGIESTLSAALHIIHRGTSLQPAWAAGSAGNMRDFPLLAGIEALTILVDNDASGTGQEAAAACARRWLDAGREAIRLTPKMVGQDFNDIIRKGAA
jgi:hypothetical protein